MNNLLNEKIKGILFDLDGVLYVGNRPVEGAIVTLNWLREKQLPFRFITNTSTRSTEEVADRLRSMGFAVDSRHIFSAVTATRDYLRNHGSPIVHLLVRDSLRTEFAQFPQQQAQPDFVVVGDIGADWDYPLLNQVFNELMGGAKLVAMHMNKYWQTEQGLQMDIGAFVAGLEFVTGQHATVIGKPSTDFFHLAARSMEMEPEQLLMIGDDIENDVGGAQAAGLQGVLVRTGKYRAALARQSEITPNAVIDSIAQLPALLNDARS